TTFSLTNFDPGTVQFHLHNDYKSLTTGLKEGFHLLRARAFLKRDGQAPLYQTFNQTFYYDAQTPEAAIVYPATNGDTVGGSSYEVVIRTDVTVTEVWAHIDDSDTSNDDATTKSPNGNGAGGDPYVDANGSGQHDAGETFTDLNGDGIYTAVSSVGAWVQVGEVTQNPAVQNSLTREFRFRYKNIPSSGTAALKLRFLEASSSHDFSLTPAVAHLTEIVRTVNTAGPLMRMNIAWPQRDGDTVGENYLMKVYLSGPIADGLTLEQILSRIDFSIASTESGTDRGAVTQRLTSENAAMSWGSYGANGAFRELAIKLPNLYNDQPDFLHRLRITYNDPVTGVVLEEIRFVKAYPNAKPFITITNPAERDSDGKNYEIILSDGPGPDSLRFTVQVQTSLSATSVTLSGAPAITVLNETYVDANGNGQFDGQEPYTDTNNNGQHDADEVFTDLNSNGLWDANEQPSLVDSNGNKTWDGITSTVNATSKIWSIPWMITAPGNYQLTATASNGSNSSSTTRTARVLLREPSGSTDTDSDDDGLGDVDEITAKELPTSTSDGWSNGDVHVHYAYGKSLSTCPDSDGDGLPDGLEAGWRTAANPPTDATADVNGDGFKNFIGDMDPPLYSVVENSGTVPGVGSLSLGDDRSRQAAGSVTDSANPDTDSDGILDGVEDANRNGWTDGDGKSLPLTATIAQYTAARPNAGDWPNNKIDSFETWTETSPTSADSDDDALKDGYGEDKNGNGFIDGDSNKNRTYDAGEAWTETNPLKLDTDGDGLPDGWEATNNLDPLDNGTDNYRTATANDGSTSQGASGDPDNDGKTNLQEFLAGTDPQKDDSVPPIIGDGTIRIGTFADWLSDDLLILDEYDEGGNVSDIYRSSDGYDSSRDLVGISFRDGGDTAAGGDGKLYFRADFLELQANAWQGYVDCYLAINVGNVGTGEKALPDQVDLITTMGWQAVAAVYGQNSGTVYVDTDPTNNTDNVYQDPSAAGFGVVSRGVGANGLVAAQWSSALDACEFSINRDTLKALGWSGDPNTLHFQAYTTKDGTGNASGTVVAGAGDLSGRNDLRDTVGDDWITSDYWKDSSEISLNAKLTEYFGRNDWNDRGKSAKVMLVAHGNQAIQPGSVIQNLLRSGTPTAGYSRLLQTHEAYNAPLTLHVTPTLASALQWAVNPNAGAWPNNDGPTFNTRLRSLVASGKVSLIGSAFADHVPKYFLQDFNNQGKALSEEFLDTIYGTGTASRNVFWPTERILDTTTLQTIANMGYSHTFADQMRHLFKWFGRSSALGESGYRINQVNGIKIFPLHDTTSAYLEQTYDEGSAVAVRQLLSRRARSDVQDQVVGLLRDLGDFSTDAKAANYDANVRWLASRPWVKVVTAEQIAGGQVGYKGTDGNTYMNWGTVDRGTSQALVQTAKDGVDHATQENYDNWYNGSANEVGLKNQTFGTPNIFGQVGVSGNSHLAWVAANSLPASKLRT
ncbi:MAG: hypothetical protein JHC52_05845, partial [Chthoniobacterales bacterium]|nr:hypothetical protein [Chthoniobacterales bacterium]